MESDDNSHLEPERISGLDRDQYETLDEVENESDKNLPTEPQRTSNAENDQHGHMAN